MPPVASVLASYDAGFVRRRWLLPLLLLLLPLALAPPPVLPHVAAVDGCDAGPSSVAAAAGAAAVVLLLQLGSAPPASSCSGFPADADAPGVRGGLTAGGVGGVRRWGVDAAPTASAAAPGWHGWRRCGGGVSDTPFGAASCDIPPAPC